MLVAKTRALQTLVTLILLLAMIGTSFPPAAVWAQSGGSEAVDDLLVPQIQSGANGAGSEAVDTTTVDAAVTGEQIFLPAVQQNGNGREEGFAFQVEAGADSVTLLAPLAQGETEAQNDAYAEASAAHIEARLLRQDEEIAIDDLSYDFLPGNRLLLHFALRNISSDTAFQQLFFTTNEHTPNVIHAVIPNVSDADLGDGILDPGEKSSEITSVVVYSRKPFRFVVKLYGVVYNPPPSTCALHPIAFHNSTLANIAIGQDIVDILNGTEQGNFGWLSWRGDQSILSLIASLLLPGTSRFYTNPENSDDHVVSIGDWVHGRLDAANAIALRAAMELLKGRNVSVPVWSEAQSSGGALRYRVAAFAKIRILSYRLSGQDKISVRFLGYDSTCGDVPVVEARNDAYSLDEDSMLTINTPGLLGNDSNTDGAVLTANLGANPSHGTLTLRVDGSFDYTSNANFNGSDSFTYRANNGTSDSNLATVTLTVRPVNDQPLAGDDKATVDEDQAVVVSVLGNDSDSDDDPLTVAQVADPTHGATEIQDSGTIRYMPDGNYHGQDSFSYTIGDGQGGTDTAIVEVTVTPLNDAPLAHDDNTSTAEDTLVTISVLDNDSDPDDGDTLTVSATSTPGDGSAVINADQTVLYTPNADYSGTDSFTYTVCDQDLACVSATVFIAVGQENDPPIAQDDTASTAEDIPVLIDVAANDSDVDLNLDPTTVVVVDEPQDGTLTDKGDGSFEYTPHLNFNGADSFTYNIFDTDGLWALATVNIDVTAVNDAPVAGNDSYEGDEDQPLIAASGLLDNDNDIDSPALTAVLVSEPANGSLLLRSDGSFVYTPQADFHGSDSFSYKTNDGALDSEPATVEISIQAVNDAPVGGDDSANVDEDGTVEIAVLSNDLDVEGDPLHIVSVSEAANGTAAANAAGTSITYIPNPNHCGSDSFTYTLSDSQGVTDIVSVAVLVDCINDAPLAVEDFYATDSDKTLTVGAPGVLVNDTDTEASSLTAVLDTEPSHGTLVLETDGSFTYTPNGIFDGVDSFTYKASDGDLQSEAVTVEITVIRANGTPTAQDDTYSVLEGETLSVAAPGVLGNDSDPDGNALSATLVDDVAHGVLDLAADGSFTYTTPDTGYFGDDSFTYKANDEEADSNLATVIITVVHLPSDPAAVASAIDPTVATKLADATAFLYTGSDPIQTGVAAGTIAAERAAVVRGKVANRDGNPLPGVTITILDHPELGETLTRADGMFDLAVNGGSYLTVNYTKDGYLPVQRKLDIPWSDYIWLPDVVMIPEDPNVTGIDLTANLPIQVARGSVISDLDGTRQATLLIPQGTQAQIFDANSVLQPVTSLHLRLTEFTVGESGPQAMPGELPSNSGYTYAVELGVEEAISKVNGRDIIFNQRVIFYLENFLNMQVGVPVPMGYYDPDAAAWVPYESGRIVRIISHTGGMADLDVTGDGVVDSGAALTDLGITDAERSALVTLYAAGQSLWRARLDHLSRWDANQGTRCFANDCASPNVSEAEASTGDDIEGPSCQGGSVIECQNQVLGEQIGIVGTPFALHYHSNRAPGYLGPYALDIPLSGATIHPRVKRIDLNIRIAGREFNQSFSPAPNLKTTFLWDGRDAYGRTLQGAQKANIRVGWVYELEYVRTERFGYNGNGVPISANPARQEFTMWKTFSKLLENLQTPRDNLGGWSLDVQHAYDPVARMLYQGDGGRHEATAFGPVVDTVAGSGATAQSRGYMTTGPDGSLYMVENFSRIVRRYPDGTRVTVAGNGPRCNGVTTAPCGDGGPALQAGLGTIIALALGPDASLYMADSYLNKVRRIGPDGIITTFAGTGIAGDSGDGGPATQARLDFMGAITVGPDGSVYIADEGNGTSVRRVDPFGIINIFAGGGTSNAALVRATSAAVSPRGMAIGPDGLLYLASFITGISRIRRVRADGMIETLAGGNFPSLGDGGPGLQASFGNIEDIEFGPDGSLYIADSANTPSGQVTNRVRRLGQDGIITTVAGTGQTCQSTAVCGDGGPAMRASLSPFGLAIAPDGVLYVGMGSSDRIRRLRPALPDNLGALEHFITSEDGTEVYAFTGRHQRTLDARTGALLYSFSYNSVGNLISVTDGDGNVTTVERDSNGLPTAVVGPFGQRTLLTLDANGYLASVTNPANETVLLTHNDDGLLTGMTTARGHTHSYHYDDLGQLTRDDDPAGGYKALVESKNGNIHSVSVTTALGRSTLYKVQDLSTGTQQRDTTNPAGLNERQVRGANDTRVTTYTDGSVSSITLGPDPRFMMQAPLAATGTFVTPGGISYSYSEQRTASLANPLDPLSVNTLTESRTINGRVYASTYVAATRRLTNVSPTGRQVVSTLDSQGRPLQVEIAELLPLNYTYDVRGRLTTITQGTRIVSITYNDAGLPETMTDPLNQVTTFTYDEVGRIVSQNLPGNRVIKLAYDADGNMTALTPPDKPAHNFTYTPVDLAATYAPPDVGAGGNQTQYVYNLDRQPTQIIRPDGQTLAMSYDTAGRLQTLAVPGRTITYAYHPSTGNLNTIGVAGGVNLAYTFDGPLLKTESWSGTVAGTVGRTYDNNSRVIARTVNSTPAITFQYDNDDLLTQAGALSLTNHPQNGLLTGTTLQNVTTAYGYNGFGELTSHTASLSGSSLHDVVFERDDLGRITGKSETIGGVTTLYDYTYDAAGQLASEIVDGITVAAYSYDANGNRLSVTRPGSVTNATYDNQDRLLTYGAANYTYSANGELANRTTPGGTTNYTYDALGNLVTVNLPDGTQIGYVVDGQDRRVGRQVNGVLVQGWLYQDQLKPLAEVDGSGNVVATFVYATHENVPEYMVKGGVTYRLLTDHLGSVRLVLNASTGQIVQRMDYDAFGRVLSDSNPGFQPFGFAGGLYDAATGLVRFGARDYDAEVGRWTAKDPIRFAGGDMNIYGYTSQNPVNRIDPQGLDWGDSESTTMGTLGAAGAAANNIQIGGLIGPAGGMPVGAIGSAGAAAIVGAITGVVGAAAAGYGFGSLIERLCDGCVSDFLADKAWDIFGDDDDDCYLLKDIADDLRRKGLYY